MPYANLREVLARINETVGFLELDNELIGPNQHDVFGDTPLGIAAIWGDAEAVRLLLEAGAEVNARQNDGMTPLHYASIPDADSIEVVRLLLSAGALLDPVDELFNRTPLGAAKARHKLEIVALIEAEQERRQNSG